MSMLSNSGLIAVLTEKLKCRRSRWALSCCAMIAVLPATAAHAQELEPRAYSSSPVGTNFLVAGYTRLTGDVLPDPSLPITDVHADIDGEVLGYARTMGIAGHSASMALLVPFVQGDISGNVFEQRNEVHRAGLGDIRMRFAFSLFGSPALNSEEFARHAPTMTVGTSLTVIAPTGKYDPAHLVNIGTNRWAYKPEIGISKPFGKWFAEGTLGVWLFSKNTDFFGGQTREQDPLSVIQLHGGYTFRPRLWLAADAGFYRGGRSIVNDIPRNDRQKNTRYGLTLSVPVKKSWSAKLGWSKGLATRAGGDYDSLSVLLQYAWFAQ